MTIDFSKLTDLDAVYRAIGQKYFELVRGQPVEFAAKKGKGTGKKKTAKPNCTPGKSFSCGYSCQSVKRSCKNPLEGQAKNYAEWMSMQAQGAAKAAGESATEKPKRSRRRRSEPAATPTPAAVPTPTPAPKSKEDPFPPINKNIDDDVVDFVKVENAKDNDIEHEVWLNFRKQQIPDTGISMFDVDFEVDENYDAIDVDPKTGIRIGQAIRRKYEEMFAEMPDGTILQNTPHEDDGKGKGRRRLYERAGFSSEPDRKEMYAIIQNGKPRPITWDQLNKLIEDTL